MCLNEGVDVKMCVMMCLNRGENVMMWVCV